MAYSDQLKSPKWQKKRLEILNRDNFKCKICGDIETQLHVHHKKYIKGCKAWEYPDDNFVSLCCHCHLVTEFLKESGIVIISIKQPYRDNILVTCVYIDILDSLNISLLFINKLNEITLIKEIAEYDMDKFSELFNSARKLIK